MNWCGLTRRRITLAADRGDGWPEPVARHLDLCPACRRFARTQRALGESLRAEADSLKESAPPFLRARILARLGSESPGHDHRFFRLLNAPVGVAIGLTALAAVLVLIQPFLTESGIDRIAQRTDPETSPPAQLALPASDELLRLSERLDDPLLRELEWLKQDAEMTVRALARNFGPEVLAP